MEYLGRAVIGFAGFAGIYAVGERQRGGLKHPAVGGVQARFKKKKKGRSRRKAFSASMDGEDAAKYRHTGLLTN